MTDDVLKMFLQTNSSATHDSVLQNYSPLLHHFLFSNAIFSGGLLLGIVAYLTTLCQSFLIIFFQKLAKFFFVQVSIVQADNLYDIVLEYLDKYIADGKIVYAHYEARHRGMSYVYDTVKLVLPEQSTTSFFYHDEKTGLRGRIYFERQATPGNARTQDKSIILSMYKSDSTLIVAFLKYLLEWKKKNTQNCV